MIIIPDKLRRPAEVEREELRKQLADARAEIERLRARNAILDNAIAEVTEEQAALCAEGQTITELVAAKDKLIEQMRDGLESGCVCCPNYHPERLAAVCGDCKIKAALSAAERGV